MTARTWKDALKEALTAPSQGTETAREERHHAEAALCTLTNCGRSHITYLPAPAPSPGAPDEVEALAKALCATDPTCTDTTWDHVREEHRNYRREHAAALLAAGYLSPAQVEEAIKTAHLLGFQEGHQQVAEAQAQATVEAIEAIGRRAAQDRMRISGSNASLANWLYRQANPYRADRLTRGETGQ